MPKKFIVTTCLSALILGFFLLHCNLPQPPAGPEDAKVTLLLKTSDGKIDRSGSIIDSVGKEVQIGIVLNLTQYIDSSVVRLLFEADTVRTFPWAFKKNMVDTVFFSITFTKAGIHKVEVTSYITDQPNSVAEGKIIIYGPPASNHAPQWKSKNVQRTLKTGAQFSYDLGSNCSDLDKDTITFSLITAKPVGDTIVGSTYLFTPAASDTGKHTVHIIVKDPAGLADTLTLGLTVSAIDIPDSDNDTSGPVITLVNPARDSVTISTNSYIVALKITDPSGVLSVNGTAGTMSLTGVRDTGSIWKINVNNLENNKLTAIVLTATDSSSQANKTFDTVYIKSEITNGYTIKFVKNDSAAVGTMADQTINSGDSAKLAANTFVKEGSQFAGWMASPTGTTIAYADGAMFKMGTAAVTLYARWIKKATFVLTITATNGTVTKFPDAAVYDTGSTVGLKAKANTGYKFVNWSGDATGTTDSTTVVVNKGTSITANFSSTPYTVTFSSQGTTYSTATVNYNALATEPAAPQGGSCDTFGGWYTSETYATKWDFLTAKVTSDTTLFAKWTKRSYIVTYNSNGAASGTPPAQQTKTCDVALTLASNSGNLAKTGVTFSGWNTTADGTGADYPQGSSYTANAPIALFAKWKTDSLMVTFNSNGGSTVAFKMVPYGGYATEPAVPTKTGFAFAGWYSNQSLSSPFDFATAITVARTLYAKWNPVFTVTYNANGGTGAVPIDNNKYENGQVVTVLGAGSLGRTNYTFAGWNTQADTLGTNFGVTFSMGNANVTLYAKWRMNAPVITTHPLSTTCPINASVTFSIVASGASLNYQWQKNNGNIADATSASYTPPALTVADTAGSTTYLCVVNNAGGSITSNGATLSVSTLTDVDGNIYHQVKIGTQTWTMENFRATKYTNSTPVPKDPSAVTWENAITPKYCYYNNTSNADSIKKFGPLYNWYVVDPSNTYKIAPSGWHVPTDAEWDVLQNYLIANGYNWDNTTADNKIAKSMAAKTDWDLFEDAGTIGSDLSKNNKSGFSALPTGYRPNNGAYFSQGFYGYYWSSTANVDMPLYAWFRYLGSSTEDFLRNTENKSLGFPVRLLKD